MSLHSHRSCASWLSADNWKKKCFTEHAHFELSTVADVQLNFRWDNKFDGIMVIACNRRRCYLQVCCELLRPDILRYSTSASTRMRLCHLSGCYRIWRRNTKRYSILYILFSSSGLICNCYYQCIPSAYLHASDVSATNKPSYVIFLFCHKIQFLTQ
jgi:hypothetical protein